MNRDSDQRRKGLSCYVCGDLGHKAAFCPRRARAHQTTEYRQSSHQSNIGGVRGPEQTAPRSVQATPENSRLRTHPYSTRTATGALRGPQTKQSLAISTLDHSRGDSVGALPRVPMFLQAQDGHKIPVAVLFDTGSDISLISPAVRDRLLATKSPSTKLSDESGCITFFTVGCASKRPLGRILLTRWII